LEGSVRKQGDRVRISVQLIRTLDGFNVWSETFDRLLKDIFVVQEDIANAISNNLEIELDLATTPTLISARTENMKVYDLYLESKMLMSRRGAENLNKALLLLNDATKLEPDYAAAWGLLAQAHTLAYYYHEIESTLVGMYLGEEAARRALEIDPASSLAHGALGDILKDKYHWEGAEEQYLLALKYDPENTEARSQYSQLLARTGRFSDALPYTEKSVVLDPLGTIYNLTSGVILHNLNRIDEGLYYFDKSIEIAGDTSFFPYGIRLVAGIKEDDKELTQDFL
jgi:adenylate cyclase